MGFQGTVLEVPIMLNPSLYGNLPSLKIRKNLAWQRYLKTVHD